MGGKRINGVLVRENMARQREKVGGNEEGGGKNEVLVVEENLRWERWGNERGKENGKQ